MRNNLRNDQVIDTLYRKWIEQNLQRLANSYQQHFGPSEEGRTIYTQKKFHDYCIAEALAALRILDPDLFRTILVDYLINTHYSLNQVKVDKEYWNTFFSKKDEPK